MKDDAVLDAELARPQHQALAIGFALVAQKVRMRCSEHHVDGARAGLDDPRHGVDHGLDALVRREEAEGQNDGLSAEPEFRLGGVRLHEGTIGYSVRDDLDLVGRLGMRGQQDLATFLRHDDDLRRNADDLAHHVALCGRGICEHRVKRRDDGHVEAREEPDDIAAGLAAKNSVFVLKVDHIDARGVQEFGGTSIVVDPLFADLEADALRIIVGLIRVGHCDDRGFETGASRRDGLMKIVGECRDAAAAWKLISDEGDPVKSGHKVSRRPLRRHINSWNSRVPVQKSDADKA